MPNDLIALSFSMKDLVGGQPLTPKTVDLSTLRGFLEEVERLVKGDIPDVSLADSRVRIEDGSLRVVVLVSALIAASVKADIKTLSETNDLDAIQAKRAQVVEAWQSRAHRSPNRVYALDSFKPSGSVFITNTSRFLRGGENSWVGVEKYLVGKVVDLGGKQDPKIHLVIGDSEESIRIGATEEQLASERENRLYRQVTVRVQGEQHLRTRKLRELRLIQFLPRHIEADESLLAELWRKGKEAWIGIGSASEWVEKMRGNS
jgi:hypothetical protein